MLSESTILLNLTPEEAQKYIDGSSSVLNYAPKLGVEPLPTDKKSYYQGKIIEQPEAFLQENYNANQFHGQVNIFLFYIHYVLFLNLWNLTFCNNPY